MNKKLRVVDFFCGAGGFSEGFSQANFMIIKGIDNWLPAVTTHNINHGLNDEPMSVLEFENIDAINQLPDSEVIVGSPPCVSFSLSNKGGTADKSLGIRLIEAYLRVVAVKKHQPNSILKSWLMENVPNSKNYVKAQYTFEDLNLQDWALGLNIDPQSTALNASSEGAVLIASDFGTAQSRRRFVCGEIVATNKFPMPTKSHTNMTVGDIRKSLPPPLRRLKTDETIVDPNYPHISLLAEQFTDHHYDTGVYEVEWQKAKALKTNHPYMGKMSLPENEIKPSRTIMATRSASTREAILYKSEIKRKGDGEYRLPTVREAATIMGFPLTYVFYGNEANKWRQVGNAVCPQMSFALANSIRADLGFNPVIKPSVKMTSYTVDGIVYLDDFKKKSFDNPPKKNKDALFRAHPIKSGNMTVELTNRNKEMTGRWGVFVNLGTGHGYRSVQVDIHHRTAAKDILLRRYPRLIEELNPIIGRTIYTQIRLDKMNREYGYISDDPNHPYNVIKMISQYVYKHDRSEVSVDVTGTILADIKSNMPLCQVISIFTMGSIFSEK